MSKTHARMLTVDIEGNPDFSDRIKSIMDAKCSDQQDKKTVIDVAISGPGLPNLSLTDVPSFMSYSDVSDALKAELKHTSANSSNTILVIVMKPVNDINSSKAFKLARELDPDLKRSIFVITNCEELTEETRKEVSKVLENSQINAFAVTSHLRNSNYSTETEFFDGQEFWRSQPQTRLGIHALTKLLSERLIGLVKPKKEEIQTKLVELCDSEERQLKKIDKNWLKLSKSKCPIF